MVGEIRSGILKIPLLGIGVKVVYSVSCCISGGNLNKSIVSGSDPGIGKGGSSGKKIERRFSCPLEYII
jgi:hypothetical protein